MARRCEAHTHIYTCEIPNDFLSLLLLSMRDGRNDRERTEAGSNIFECVSFFFSFYSESNIDNNINDMITMIGVIDGCVPRRLSGHRKTICRWSNSYTFTHIFFLVFLSFVRPFLLLSSTMFSFHQRCNDTVSLDIFNNILLFEHFF